MGPACASGAEVAQRRWSPSVFTTVAGLFTTQRATHRGPRPATTARHDRQGERARKKAAGLSVRPAGRLGSIDPDDTGAIGGRWEQRREVNQMSTTEETMTPEPTSTEPTTPEPMIDDQLSRRWGIVLFVVLVALFLVVLIV